MAILVVFALVMEVLAEPERRSDQLGTSLGEMTEPWPGAGESAGGGRLRLAGSSRVVSNETRRGGLTSRAKRDRPAMRNLRRLPVGAQRMVARAGNGAGHYQPSAIGDKNDERELRCSSGSWKFLRSGGFGIVVAGVAADGGVDGGARTATMFC
jgi:hypothetical protein